MEKNVTQSRYISKSEIYRVFITICFNCCGALPSDLPNFNNLLKTYKFYLLLKNLKSLAEAPVRRHQFIHLFTQSK
jgi:hypothetical protein